MKWQTQSGEYIEISKMKASHIENCLRMIAKKWPELEEDTDYLCADGDGLNAPLTVPGKDYYRPYIKAFKKELLVRKT